MYSFIPEVTTIRLLLIIGFFYGIVVLSFWRQNIIRFDIPHRPQYLLILLVIIHLLFAFEGGDYYGYHESVAKNYWVVEQEQIYPILSKILGNDYLLFRLVVWGGALGLFMLTVKRLGFEVSKAVYLLYVMYFTLFDYARATLGMALFFYGMSFWCLPIKKHKIMSTIIIGPAIMCCSTLFHHSMVIACAISWIVFIPMNKKILATLIVLFIMSTPILMSLYERLIMMALSSTSSTASKIIEYANQNTEFTENTSTFELIRQLVEYATIITPLILISYKFFDKKNTSRLHIAMQRYFKIALGFVLVAFSMLMVSNTFILFYRFLYISFIPVLLLFFYSRKNGIINKKIFKSVIIVCLLQVFFNYSKRILGGNIQW